MLHTFRADERFRKHIDRALDELKHELDLRQVATLEASTLSGLDAEPHAGGSKLCLKLRDAEGQPYLFKQAEPALAAAEEAAHALRHLGGRPGLPARSIELDLGARGVSGGVLRPFLELEHDRELDPDTRRWSVEQRAVMLLEHAWEWFLDNMDTNTSQYVLAGPLRVPLNMDWDRAFSSAATSELSRFAKYKPTLPNARTFLYADYVAGKIKLPLWLLAAEARRIRRLPKAAVRRILERYARARFDTPQEREHFVMRMLMRRHGIEREVGHFLRSLWAERRALAAPAGNLNERLHQALLLLWGDWQLVLNSVLRGPIGKLGRQLLSFARQLKTRLRSVPGPREHKPSSAH
jgi:hypothetical protein